MQNKIFDFKNTLLLPSTNFPMRASLPTRELEWLQSWEKLNIYQKLRKEFWKEDFILHDGTLC